MDEVGAGAFNLLSLGTGKYLALDGTGQLILADSLGAATFSFQPADGCAVYPEVELSATGNPLTSTPGYGEARGLIDLHMHMMAFEFLGGSVHCGRPWHKYGAPTALTDCVDHTAGCGAVLENVLFGDPARCHDTSGWPDFKGWPHHASLTHEQSYYRWLERAWMGGLRVFVNLFVENRVLCELYPLKRNSCDEMTSVRLQNRQIRAMQDYIDAQSGGPGKGFFRIVTDPFEARRVINQGKLAVVLGIEVSEPFGCQLYNDQPRCDRARIDRELDEVYGFGVRQMELINKFDNALAGVAGDCGDDGRRREQRQQVRDRSVLADAGVRRPARRGRTSSSRASTTTTTTTCSRTSSSSSCPPGRRRSIRRTPRATRAASASSASTPCGG